MEELIGSHVKVALRNTQGFVTLIGTVKKVYPQFILLDTTFGPIYVSIASITTIEIRGSAHEKK